MIGDLLRAEREKQGLSIKDIEKGTSIRSLYIDAIEKGEYKKLPGDVYAKGFIRNYANFLKMDANQAVHQYNEENHPEKIAAEEATKAAEEQSKEVPVRTAKRVSTSYPSRQEPAATPTLEERVARSNHRQTLMLGLVVVVILAVGGYFLFGSSEEKAEKPAQTKVTTSAKTQPKQEAPKKAAPAPKQYTDAEVTAKFSDRCWVSVKADGKTLFEGTIEKGETKNWKAQKELKITAGNAGAVTVSFNGQDQGVLGEVGQVVDKTYAPAEAQSASADTQKQ